jgi:hypothetical protein
MSKSAAAPIALPTSLSISGRAAHKRHAGRNYFRDTCVGVLQSSKSFCRAAIFAVLRAAPRLLAVHFCDGISKKMGSKSQVQTIARPIFVQVFLGIDAARQLTE